MLHYNDDGDNDEEDDDDGGNGNLSKKGAERLGAETPGNVPFFIFREVSRGSLNPIKPWSPSQ